jgi:hypothetical protein
LLPVASRRSIDLPQALGLHLQCLRLHLPGSGFLFAAAQVVRANAQIRGQLWITAL